MIVPIVNYAEKFRSKRTDMEKLGKCIQPKGIRAENPTELLEMLGSHEWIGIFMELDNPNGIACRYNCAKCTTEFVVIVSKKTDSQP